MNLITILFFMFVCHYIADYPLQGILAQMKQKEWWTKQNNYNDLYKYDYIIALFIHSFMWSALIMLPILIQQNLYINFRFFILLVVNTCFHAYVDNLKANLKIINLVEDQLIHFCQIMVTLIIFYLEKI